MTYKTLGIQKVEMWKTWVNNSGQQKNQNLFGIQPLFDGQNETNCGFHHFLMRLDSNIESKSSNNTYLNIIEIFNKLFEKLNIIELQNLVATSTKAK